MGGRLGKILWTFFLFLLIVAGSTSVSSRAFAATSSSHGRASFPDFSHFAGTWVAHGASLVLREDGTATFTARTYNWCDSSVARPCDRIDARGYIFPGTQEQVQFARVTSDAAYGILTSSNLQTPGLGVTIKLQPNDMLLYQSDSLVAFLCGPNAPVGACGA